MYAFSSIICFVKNAKKKKRLRVAAQPLISRDYSCCLETYFGSYCLSPVSIHRMKSLMDFSSHPAALKPRISLEVSDMFMLSPFLNFTFIIDNIFRDVKPNRYSFIGIPPS